MTGPTGAASADRLGVELYRLVSLDEPPAYVKTASAAALLGTPDLPAHCYADRDARMLPIHTAPAAWVSSARYLDKPAAYDPAVGARLDRAAAYWGIAGDVRKLAAAAATRERDDLAARPDADFALVERFDDGQTTRRLPLRNPAEVKAAADWLGRYRDELPMGDRRTVATKIMSKAAATGVDLGDAGAVVDRLAGCGQAGVRQAVGAIRGRIARLGDSEAELAEQLDKAAQVLEDDPGRWADPAVRVKLAAVLDEVDRATGLDRRYGAGIERPEDALFGVTEKMAADYLAARVATPAGAVYALDDVAGLAPAALRARCGDALTDRLADDTGLWLDRAKVAAAVPALAPDEAALLERGLGELGVRPIGPGPSAGAPRVDLELLAASMAAG